MMSSNTRCGHVYEHAMCLSIEFLGFEKALDVFDEAISLLATFPDEEAVVTWDGNTAISVKEALIHLKIRKERVERIRKAEKGQFYAFR